MAFNGRSVAPTGLVSEGDGRSVAPSRTVSQLNSEFRGNPSYLDLKEVPAVKSALSIINNPESSTEELFAANTNMQNFVNDFVIDADTFRGKTVGISSNIRSSLIDALEDPNKGHTAGGYNAGSSATAKVRNYLLNDMLLKDDTKARVYFEGKTDNRNDTGSKRELGFLISKFKDNPAEATIDAMLLKEGDAVQYRGKGESPDQFQSKMEFERGMLVDLYKKSIAPGSSPADKDKFNKLIKKSRYIDKDFIENIAESGWNAINPLDWANSYFSGVGGLAGMAQNAQAVGSGAIAKATGSKFMKNLSEQSYKNAEKYKAKAGEFDATAERGGVFNDEELNPYKIDLMAHFVEQGIQNNIGDVLQTSAKGIVQGLPEIAVSSNPLGAALFATAKAADIAVEQNGGKATVLDAVKTLPNAVAYTMLNKVEGSLLANKLLPKSAVFGNSFKKALSNPYAQKILALTSPVAKTVASAGVEGLAEGAQSLTENVKPGEMPTRKNMEQARNEAIAGVGGGAGIGGVQTIAETGVITKPFKAIGKGIGKVNELMNAAAQSKNMKEGVAKMANEARSKKEELASDEVQTQIVDFDTTTDAIAEEDEVLTQTVLFANQFESGLDAIGNKFTDSIERYEEILADGKTEGGVAITGDFEKVIKQELADLRTEENKFKADEIKFMNERIENDIATKYGHLTPEARQEAISRRESVLSSIGKQKVKTPKQAYLEQSLTAEIKAIKKISDQYDEAQIKNREGKADKVEPAQPIKESDIPAPVEALSKTESTPKTPGGKPGSLDYKAKSTGDIKMDDSAAPETLSIPSNDDIVRPKSYGKQKPEVSKSTPELQMKPQNLSKTDQKWLAKFEENQNNFKKATPKTREKYMRLLKESQIQKDKSNTQAEKMKEASGDNTEIGGSEDDQASKREKLMEAQPMTEEQEYTGMTQQEVDEMYAAQMGEDVVATPTVTPDVVTDTNVGEIDDERYVHGHNENTGQGQDFTVDSIIDNGDGTHTIKPSDWGYSITVDSETGVNAKGTWTFFFDKEDADNYSPSSSPVTSGDIDAGATMEAAIAAKPGGTVAYNENSITEKVAEGTENIYTKTDLYDLFENKDSFVLHIMDEYNLSKAEAEQQFDIAKPLYEALENELQNIQVAKPFGDMAHPADELALGKVSSKLVFDKTLMQTIFAVGYPTLQVQSTEIAALDDDELAKRYGMIDAEQILKIRDAGAGTSRVAKAIGQTVMKEMGLGKGLSVKDSEALSGDIGLLFITSLDRLGLVEKTMVSLSGGEKETSFVKFNENVNVEDLNNIEHLFASMSFEQMQFPLMEAKEDSKAFPMKRNAGLESSSEITESMNIRQNNENTINWDLLEQFENLTKEQRDAVLKIQDPMSVQASFRESVEAKNAGIRMYHSRGQVFIDSLRETPDKKFFMTESLGGNGRSNVTQGSFNYQLDKNFSRHLTNINEAEALTEKNDVVFKASVLLSLGEKPEYMFISDINEQYADINNKFFGGVEPSIEQIVDMSSKEEGMMTFHALTEMTRARAYEAKHGTLVGFVTHLSSEIDGVTNGPAYLAFQAGVTNIDIFNKIGVFTEENGSLAAYHQDGGSDMYVSINDIVQENIDKVPGQKNQQLINTLRGINMFDRNLAKKPVMVFGYGMKIDAIRSKVAEAMVVKMIEKLVSKNPEERKAANDALNQLGFHGNLTNKEFTSYEIYQAGQGMQDIANLYTDALTEQLGDILEYTENIKNLSESIFQVYEKMFEVNPELNRLMTTIYTGTPAEKKKAEKALIAIVPTLGTYSLSNDHSVYNNQQIIKTGTQSTSSTLSTRGGEKSGKGKRRQWSVKEQVSVPETGSKLAPIYIHRMDSTNMAFSTVGMNDKYNGGYGAQNIFDAIISGMNALPEYGQLYNETFFQMNKDYSVAQEMVTAAENLLAISASYNIGSTRTNAVLAEISKMKMTTLKKRAKMMQDIVPNIKVVAQMNGLPGVAHKVGNKNRLNYGNQKTFTKGEAKPTDANGVTEAFDDLMEDSEMSAEMEVTLRAVMGRITDTLYSKLKMSIQRGKKTTGGMFDFATDEIQISMSNHTKNKAAVLAHEAIHSVTAVAIEDTFSYAERRDLQNLADKVTKYMTNNRGKLIKDGTFKSFKEIDQLVKWIEASPEHEIIAYGLTNEGIMKILKGMPLKTEKAANAFVWIVQQLKKALNKASIMFNMGGSVNSNEFDKLFNTFVTLSRINKNIKDNSKLKVHLGAFYKLIDSLNEGLNKVIVDKVTWGAGLVGMNAINYNKFKNVVAEYTEQYKWLDLRNNKTLQSFYYSFTKSSGNTTLDQEIQEIAAEHTNDIERGSNNLKQITIKAIQELLEDPSLETEKAVKNAIVDTGVIDLFTLNDMTMDDVVKVLRDSKFRDKILKEHNDNLRSYISNKKQYNTVKLLIDGLVHYMATNTVTVPMLQLNATKIAEFIGDTNPELIQTIDAILSLQAVERADTTVIESLSKKQVKGVLQYANQMALESQPLFEGMERNKTKGYSHNTFNDQSEIMFMNRDTIDADSKQFDDLIDLGWTVYASNEHVVKLKSKTPKAGWQQGFFAILDSGKKGFSKYVPKAEVDRARQAMINRAQSGQGIKLGANFAIYDGGLENTQKRFVMSKYEMRKHLDLEERVSHVLGNTTSRMHRKTKSRELNARMINILEQDYRESSSYDKDKKFDTILLKPVRADFRFDSQFDEAMYNYGAQRKDLKEVADLIPSDIVVSVKDLLHVRKRVSDVIFGYRELVVGIDEDGLVGTAIQKSLSPKSLKTINKFARVIDYHWKNFVKFMKERMIVLSPAVHAGNFISNVQLLALAGVPVKEIFSRHKQGYRALEDYRADTEKWIRAQVEADAGEAGAQARADKYKAKMESNPVNESITNGLFSFIVEDVANELTVEKNSVKEMFGKTVHGAVQVGKRTFNIESSKDVDGAMKRAYVDVDTQEGIELMKLFQYSDFIAKDTLYHFKMDNGMSKAQALQEANDMFIDYRYNDSALLNFMNAFGIFPFSKFAIRIQPVLVKLAIERPASLLISLVMQGYVFDDTMMSDNFVFKTHFGLEMFHGFGSGVDPMDIMSNPFIDPFV